MFQSPIPKSRGTRVNMSGKQKNARSNNDDRKKNAAKALAPAVLPPTPNGSPPLMALANSVPGAKMGGKIATTGPNSSGLFNGQNDFDASKSKRDSSAGPKMKFGGRTRVPTQNEMLRAKKEEAAESPAFEKKEVAAGKEPKYKDGGNWIAGAVGKPGALHAEMGVPQGQTIPAGKLAKAAGAGGKLGARARLAETLKKLNK